ncbi:MAG: HEAT repeat domain-containing protein [Pyrinomonadaceae bacterium]
MRQLTIKISRRARVVGAAVSLGLGVAVCPPLAPKAQRSKEAGVNVTGVSTRTSGKDAVVSIAADAPLSRAQTWQDEEGFHVVVYKGQGAFRGSVPRGVRVRRVGESLELVVPVKPGSGVYVQPRFNNLDLIVSGGLNTETVNSAAQTSRAALREQQQQRDATAERAGQTASKPRPTSGGGSFQSKRGNQIKESIVAISNNKTKVNLTPSLPPPAALKLPALNGEQSAVTNAPNHTKNDVAVSPEAANAAVAELATNQTQAAPPAAPANEQNASPVLMQTQVSAPFESGAMKRALIVLLICLTAGVAVFLFIFLRARRKGAMPDAEEGESREVTQTDAIVVFEGAAQLVEQRQGERRNGLRRSEDKQSLVAATASSSSSSAVAPAQGLERQERKHSASAPAASVPAVLFGAYRIDQEVEKLISGQPHNIEVLATRGSDDRRALEVSLLKALHADSLSGAERERARTALEEYGFVARHSAAVLLAPDAYERSSAARALGEMRSRASLPFLLEALYDGEQIVCTEVVKSLGALALPSAIGALLDMARRHPELPPALLGRALSACSVDCLDLHASANGESFALPEGGVDPFTGEIRGLEPVEAIEQLPEWLEDETLADALERLESADVEMRVAAAQQLAQFQVRRSVEALTAMAAGDRDAAVRAAAVTSLGNIGHQSVFPSVLIAMADEAREVRAAAARALSRLSFDRADAYVRVLETADAETLRHLASACVGAGLANQALSRLASNDRRQAYEAFSLLSLVAKGGQADLILKVVEEHKDLNMRLAAARLLGLMAEPELDLRLRRIALGANAPEKLRTAILEAVYRGEPAAHISVHAAIDDDKSAQHIA